MRELLLSGSNKWGFAFILLLIFSLLSPYSPADIIIKPECTLMDEYYAPIFESIKRGDIEAVRQALNKGVNFNAASQFCADPPDSSGLSDSRACRTPVAPLDYAVVRDQQAILTLLLEHGASPEGCATGLYHPIFWAIKHEKYSTLEILVKNGADVNVKMQERYNDTERIPEDSSPLYVLIDTWNDSVSSGEINIDQLKSIELLINHGADISEVFKGNPLFLKTMNHLHNYSAALLFSHGIRLDRVFPDGGHFLHWMARKKLENPSPNYPDYWSLISNYIKLGGHHTITSPEQVNRLQQTYTVERTKEPYFSRIKNSLARNLDYLSSFIIEKPVPIFNIQQLINIQQLTTLFQHMVENPSVYSSIEWKPCNTTDLIEQCDEKSVIDLNLEDAAGNTALHYAVLNKQRRATAALIDLGADVNRPGEFGLTPLHLAVDDMDLEFIDILLKAGSDPLIKNNRGESVFDVIPSLSSPEPKQLNHIVEIASSLCRYQPDTRFSILSTEYDCLTLSQSVSFTPDCHYSYNPFIPLGLSEDEQRLCFELIPKDKIKTALSPALHETFDWSPELLSKAVNEISVRDSYDLIKQAIDYSNFDLLKRFLGVINVDKIRSELNKNTDGDISNLLQTSDHPLIIDLLLKWGLDPDYNYSNPFFDNPGKPENITLLIKALLAGDLERTKLLIRHGADIGQAGVIAAAIEGDSLETLLFIFEQGVRVENRMGLPSRDYYEDAAILCKQPNRYTNKEMPSHVALLFKLFDRTDFLNIQNQDSSQKILDTALIKAVSSLNANEVAIALAAGANPNQAYDCFSAQDGQWQSFFQAFTPCAGGLLHDAMLKEQSEPTATVSRLLLLYGASVSPVHPPDHCDLKDCYNPAAQANTIHDEKLAATIRYFDGPARPINKGALTDYSDQQVADETLKEIAGETLKEIAGETLKETAEKYGIIVDFERSPVRSCLSLKSDNEEFQPYCQKIWQQPNGEAQQIFIENTKYSLPQLE